MSVFAMANQKGGVGKTTATLNLAAAVARAGRRTLVVDCDPQASLTASVGVDASGSISLADVMLSPRDYELADALWETSWGFDLIPTETELATKERNRYLADEVALREKIAALPEAYDVVLMDCPPSLGIMTISALAAADGVVIVTQPEYLALKGISKLLETIETVRENYNAKLVIAGVVVNLVEGTDETATSIAEIHDFFSEDGSVLWEPQLPKWTLMRDSVREGVSLYDFAPADGRRRKQRLQMIEKYEALAERMTNHGS